MLLEDADLKDETEEARQLRQLKKMYLNLGLCYIKLCAPHKACICLQKLLALEPNNLKGNFRSVNVAILMLVYLCIIFKCMHSIFGLPG